MLMESFAYESYNVRPLKNRCVVQWHRDDATHRAITSSFLFFSLLLFLPSKSSQKRKKRGEKLECHQQWMAAVFLFEWVCAFPILMGKKRWKIQEAFRTTDRSADRTANWINNRTFYCSCWRSSRQWWRISTPRQASDSIRSTVNGSPDRPLTITAQKVDTSIFSGRS